MAVSANTTKPWVLALKIKFMISVFKPPDYWRPTDKLRCSALHGGLSFLIEFAENFLTYSLAYLLTIDAELFQPKAEHGRIILSIWKWQEVGFVNFVISNPINLFYRSNDVHRPSYNWLIRLFWSSVVHIIGHCLNLYHISTQPANDLACLFRNYFHP